MNEYRIVTHFTDGANVTNPWSAFFYHPEDDDQTPDDYIASSCGMLETFDLIAFGETETEAVYGLFKKQEPKNNDNEVMEIFAKNSSFGPVYEPGFRPQA